MLLIVLPMEKKIFSSVSGLLCCCSSHRMTIELRIKDSELFCTCSCMLVEETSPDQFSSLTPKGSAGWWKVMSMALRYTEERLNRTVMYSLLSKVQFGEGEERRVKHLPLAVSCQKT